MGNRAEPSAADAQGDQHGLEQHAGVWSSLGCLSSALEPASVTPGTWCTQRFWVSWISVLAPLTPSVEFAQQAMGVCHGVLLGTPAGRCGLSPGASLRGSHSAHIIQMCGLSHHPECVSLPDVPSMTRTEVSGGLAAIFVDTSDSIFFSIIHAILIGPCHFTGPAVQKLLPRSTIFSAKGQCALPARGV